MRYDIAVLGAGIAGASIAAEIAPYASVVLIEAESQPGYHATGRSAAFWSETYGGPAVQPLTSASGPFLAQPPGDFADRPFLSERRELHLARDAAGRAALDGFESQFAGSGVALDRLDRSAVAGLVPGLRSDWTDGVLEPSCTDIDAAALHVAYLRAARASGAALMTDARVEAAQRVSDGWGIDTRAGPVEAGIIVNAAGAWADAVASASGVRPLGLKPYRRTMVQLRVDPPAPEDMPLVIDALGTFYFKPETGGRLWLSPHDETPCDPCDAAAEEIDVATAIARLQEVVDWRVERVEHSWAGLRTFAPDRLPVYGFAPDAADFFWFAGQGGFGIQTAPAAAKLAAALLLGRAPDAMVAAIDPAPYAPGRLTN
ncbi:NAD(P)/FAD-dependent oxidoreductase [Allosphingosinicella indica]|uniref:NAD(P)/FAD-dependent oxidoreductase n=1 Tax=Allosphingosinicella indica TaxID=941907 RepID=UPI000A16B815|nr:FAD-binding oxidoreductase [Allosphingosinicella indica]